MDDREEHLKAVTRDNRKLKDHLVLDHGSAQELLPDVEGQRKLHYGLHTRGPESEAIASHDPGWTWSVPEYGTPSEETAGTLLGAESLLSPAQEIRARALHAAAVLYSGNQPSLTPPASSVLHIAKMFERYISGI